MPEIRGLIAAAGRGERAGLPYPKTLHPVEGKPILLRLLEQFRPVDDCPVVIVSPEGRDAIRGALNQDGASAELIVQERASGMGDAVLLAAGATGGESTEHWLLAWGDLAHLYPATVAELVRAHRQSAADFSFVTREVEEAYTRVERNDLGEVTGVTETRETGQPVEPGERDIGLFLFRSQLVLNLLAQRRDGAIGRATGEHGFLYVIRHLVAEGLIVQGLPIAGDQETISLNRLSDLDGHSGSNR